MNAPIGEGRIVAEKYRVERVLARGGSGLVVEATHLVLLEPRAIKFMLPEALATPLARERFLREAKAAVRLKSDHVVKVFDVGQLDDGAPYLVMEYLEGCDLDELVKRRGPLPPPEAALYALQICAALAEAHAQGIVHRDLKPANVFLTQSSDGTPRVKVLDFGISKVLRGPVAADGMTTEEGAFLGSPMFMAPEQIQGRDVDTRADVWALGVLLYQLLTGRLPFEGDGVLLSLARVLTSPPTPPSHRSPSIPPGLEAIVLRCLEKLPDRRPADVAEIARALEPFAPTEIEPLSRRVRRMLDSAPSWNAAPPEALVEPAAPTVMAIDPPRSLPRVEIVSPPGARRPAVAALAAVAALGVAGLLIWQLTPGGAIAVAPPAAAAAVTAPPDPAPPPTVARPEVVPIGPVRPAHSPIDEGPTTRPPSASASASASARAPRPPSAGFDLSSRY